MTRPILATLLALATCPPLTPSPAADRGAKDGTISFAGRAWEVKEGRRLGPGPNDWSAGRDSVRVDDRGHLHLAIAPAGGKWTCSEVALPASLGHGEYRWVVAGDLDGLPPRAVLGLFLYEDDTQEVDFELSRWGVADSPNAQFVVQPTVPARLRRFATGPVDRLTVSLTWGPGSIRGRAWAGTDTDAPPIADWTHAGPQVPKHGKERAIMNFWLMDGRPDPGMARREVVIRSFDFRPAPASKPRQETHE